MLLCRIRVCHNSTCFCIWQGLLLWIGTCSGYGNTKRKCGYNYPDKVKSGQAAACLKITVKVLFCIGTGPPALGIATERHIQCCPEGRGFVPNMPGACSVHLFCGSMVGTLRESVAMNFVNLTQSGECWQIGALLNFCSFNPHEDGPLMTDGHYIYMSNHAFSRISYILMLKQQAIL